MPRVLAVTQRELWEFHAKLICVSNDTANRLGPFKVLSAEQTYYRYLDCENYAACLNHAARNMWNSFSCFGCRKTDGMAVEEVNCEPRDAV
jgi:hypothetical protein